MASRERAWTRSPKRRASTKPCSITTSADKDALYGAVLDEFFVRMYARIMQVFDSPGSAGERILRYVCAHFDAIAASPYYARLFQREMMSPGRFGSPHLARTVEQYIFPISQRVMSVLGEGVDSGEFRAVDVRTVRAVYGGHHRALLRDRSRAAKVT